MRLFHRLVCTMNGNVKINLKTFQQNRADVLATLHANTKLKHLVLDMSAPAVLLVLVLCL